MSIAPDYHNTAAEPSKMWVPTRMKLTRSASEQNIYFTYVCLIKEDNLDRSNCTHLQSSLYAQAHETDEGENEDEPIQITRTMALHELIQPHEKDNKTDVSDSVKLTQTETTLSNEKPTTSEDGNPLEDDEGKFLSCDCPNILKLTKMKWLSESQNGSLDARSLSPSSTVSTTSSNCSNDSDDKNEDLNEKCLSTILKLDKEHNMFGLSNITIVGSKQMKKNRKKDKKPVFHQTAIVQICCGTKCCRHKSNTDFPSSLKCRGCKGYLSCIDPCTTCPSDICGPVCDELPCTSSVQCSRGSHKCSRGQCCYKKGCKPLKCSTCCAGACFGLKVVLRRKPEEPPPPVIEITPRASCVQQLPMAARTCHHQPRCIPPSSCFPYLMPCFWPVRPSAPCNTPTRCFHQPPCLPPRQATIQMDLNQEPSVPTDTKRDNLSQKLK